MASTIDKRPTFGSAPVYENPAAALDWLEKAFGFRRSMVITDDQGRIAHCEMEFGDGYLMLGSKWNESMEFPTAIGGRNTQTIHVHLNEGVDAHCERARAAGAEILQAPETQFYGDRTYRCRDLGGHIWTFGQTVQVMQPEEWDAAGGGLKTEMFE
jgi:uncharacterized glyoxalase superfamily protein PhnB